MAPISYPLDMVTEQEEDFIPSDKSFYRKLLPYRPTYPDVLPARSTRVSMLAFAMMQNAMAGGLIFGWSAIDQSILAEPLESGGTGLDPQQSTQIFSWATSIAMGAALVLGALLDHAGPRVASILSCLVISVGCFIFATSSKMPGFALGTIMIGFGGPGVGNCIIHIANLFPGNPNLAMSCLGGSVAFSFSVFAAFDFVWNAYHPRLSFRHLFGGYGMIMLFVSLGALWLYPDEAFEEFIEDDEEANDDERGSSCESTPFANETRHHEHNTHGHPPIRVSLISEQPIDSYLRDTHHIYERTDSYLASSKSLAQGGPVLSLKDLPLRDQLRSGAYLRAFLVFSMTCFLTNFYVGSLSMELRDRDDFSTQGQRELTRWFNVIMGFGIVGSLLVGWLIDRVGLEICTSMTLLLGQLQMMLVILGSNSKTMMLLSFIAYTLFRAFLYPVFISSLTTRLGFKYFGILLGTGFALSGVTQLLFPFLISNLKGDCNLRSTDENKSGDCDHGEWQKSEMLQFIFLGLMHIIPIMDYRDSVNRKRNIQKVLLASPLVTSTYEGRHDNSSPDSHES